MPNHTKESKIITSFMIMAVRFVFESSNSTSVFPLTVTRPRPLRYASKMLDKGTSIRSFIANNWIHSIRSIRKAKQFCEKQLTYTLHIYMCSRLCNQPACAYTQTCIHINNGVSIIIMGSIAPALIMVCS